MTVLLPVLWIRDILVRIHWLTDADPGLDPDPAFFVSGLQDVDKNILFFFKVFCLLLFDGTITSVFKY
jgi:hypothetical protein